jgi:hypothetical protein
MRVDMLVITDDDFFEITETLLQTPIRIAVLDFSNLAQFTSFVFSQLFERIKGVFANVTPIDVSHNQPSASSTQLPLVINIGGLGAGFNNCYLCCRCCPGVAQSFQIAPLI